MVLSRLAMVWHPTNWTGCYCSGQTTLVHTYTICVICTRGRASPSSTVRQRTPPLGSLYPSDKCELPVPRLRTALQVQDRPAEPLPYPQIRGTDNVILETEGPSWWWWPVLHKTTECVLEVEEEMLSYPWRIDWCPEGERSGEKKQPNVSFFGVRN